MSIAGHLLCLLLSTAQGGPAPESLTPSDRCGQCHRDIYRMWRASAHARAMENPDFLSAYREIESRQGAEQSRVCLDCHAPMAGVIADGKLARQISWEGVTCDFCHSLLAVELADGRPEHRIDVGRIKRGPIRDAASTGHDVAYSELFTRSIICAPCHEFSNADGTALMTTYSEWKVSRAAARGQTCQTCHMAVTEADVVDARILRDSTAAVNLHEMPGGHSLDQLHRALGVSMKWERDADRLDLTVELRNKGAGHAVPTGMPGRRIELQVRLESEGVPSFEGRRIYGKSYADARGRKIVHVGELFGQGIRLQTDSRIGVDEVRTELFRIPLPAEATAYVAVKLIYAHAPRGTEEDGVRLTFFSERRTILPVD